MLFASATHLLLKDKHTSGQQLTGCHKFLCPPLTLFRRSEGTDRLRDEPYDQELLQFNCGNRILAADSLVTHILANTGIKSQSGQLKLSERERRVQESNAIELFACLLFHHQYTNEVEKDFNTLYSHTVVVH